MPRTATFLIQELLEGMQQNKKWMSSIGIIGAASSALLFGELACSLGACPFGGVYALFYKNPFFYLLMIAFSWVTGASGVNLLEYVSKWRENFSHLLDDPRGSGEPSGIPEPALPLTLKGDLDYRRLVAALGHEIRWVKLTGIEGIIFAVVFFFSESIAFFLSGCAYFAAVYSDLTYMHCKEVFPLASLNFVSLVLAFFAGGLGVRILFFISDWELRRDALKESQLRLATAFLPTVPALASRRMANRTQPLLIVALLIVTAYSGTIGGSYVSTTAIRQQTIVVFTMRVFGDGTVIRGAEVWFDGSHIGKTDLDASILVRTTYPPVVHWYRVSATGYRDAEGEVRIGWWSGGELSVSMTPQGPVSVVFTMFVIDSISKEGIVAATVWFDGSLVGVTNFNGYIYIKTTYPPSDHTYSIRATGYRNVTNGIVTIGPSSGGFFTVYLSRQ